MAGGGLRPAGDGITLLDAVLRTLSGLQKQPIQKNCNVM